MFGQSDVAIRFGHQITHEIIHVRAYIACLAEFCRIRFHKRHANEIGDVFDEIGLTDPRRADNDDVLLGKFEPRSFGICYAILT